MRKVLHTINEFISAFSGWLMLLMMALLLLDIVSRGIDKPFQGIAEMSVFVMMVVIYLGLARCEENDENVRIEIFLHLMPWKIKKLLLVLINVIQIGVVSIFLYEMSRNTWIAFSTHEAVAGTVQLPIWPVKVLIVIGLFFYLMALLMNTATSIKRARYSKDPSAKQVESPDLPSDVTF